MISTQLDGLGKLETSNLVAIAFFLVGRLTIPTSEGTVYREATGTEELKREKFNSQTGELEIKEIAYGDPSSNAESMCFRRAAAKLGLALYLYKTD